MKKNRDKGRQWILMAAGVCWATTAWADMDMSGTNANMDMSGMKMDKADLAFSQAMDASMKKMDHDMASGKMTGDPDHDFVVMMIPHHQGAVDMAEVELKYGKDPELLALCRRIIVAQKKEIAQMNAWLADHPGTK